MQRKKSSAVMPCTEKGMNESIKRLNLYAMHLSIYASFQG